MKKKMKYSSWQNLYYSFILSTIIFGSLSFLFWYIDWLIIRAWIFFGIFIYIVACWTGIKK